MSLTSATTQLGSWRTLGTGAALLIAGRVVAAACGLMQVPIALTYLGPERFGVWIALTGLLWTFSGFDGGVGFAAQNRIAMLLARGQDRDAAGFAHRGVCRLCGFALLIALGGGVLALWGRWPEWLGVTDPALAAETAPAVALTFAAAALAVPLSLATRVAAAMQQTWITGLWTAVASVAGLIAVVIATRLHWSLPGFMVAACILPLAPHAATWLHLRYHGAWLAKHAGAADNDAVLWRESMAFFVPQLGAAFVGSFVPPLVAFFAGPAATASYGVLQRLFGLALQLQTLALQPTWPAYTHAAALGDSAGARKIFRTSMLGAVVCIVVLIGLLVPFTREILRLWLGAATPDFSTALLWTVAGWHAAQSLGQPPAMLLNGAGRAAVVALTTALCIALSLTLCAWLGPRWGAVGVIAALAVPYIVLNLPLVIWQAARTLALIGLRPVVSPA